MLPSGLGSCRHYLICNHGPCRITTQSPIVNAKRGLRAYGYVLTYLGCSTYRKESEDVTISQILAPWPSNQIFGDVIRITILKRLDSTSRSSYIVTNHWNALIRKLSIAMASQKIPEKMQAAQVVEFNKPYSIHQVPVPTELAPNDLIIKVAVASLCHTDSMVQSGIMGTSLPCTGSHEGAGTVVALGSSVQDFILGDRVMAGIIYRPCGVCADCLGPENYQQYCQFSGGYCGVTTNGFFADYARIDATQAAKLPDKVTFETAAPLACAGCTVYRGVVLSGVKKGEWLAIVGSGGGLGHLGVQFAKALGMNVIGVDARDEGLELTRKGGANMAVDARKGHENVVKEVHKVTNNEGVTCTLNVSDAEKAMATACAITKMHGTVIQIAQPENVAIPFRELIFRDIRVRGSLIGSPNEARDMLQIVAEHNISVETNAFRGLGELEKLVHLAHSGKMKGKGIIVMTDEHVPKEKEIGAAL
ncbi:hypothetical protein HBH56_071090 [Parastagonospora nodorum]|uniref:Enoyl reductase (ER) domain-containing protein n=1 Tax=Phaeosphaeria nodorum (strain SN15 / ATCC MYA-4574 / FGSC 10173) TaxID=321614 RepID=A0A7U2EVY7_PHANO|nr:hypothetical protein HBH56_071090 [Parastagonospora nodorum]QRC93727.1 hypothetical protein JI435_039210 [Parastagonospora nodorum SN15]KAH3932805.1 hypothetical protein HBH54_077020 [Parastagonospora nodorum]KAH4004884.1 hypothetical protein HBI10_039090 [Parastagonospora nodorum]KAH4030605.1 hypothetical protein HBI13_022540 [Parastagonospora nodorum]